MINEKVIESIYSHNFSSYHYFDYDRHKINCFLDVCKLENGKNYIIKAIVSNPKQFINLNLGSFVIEESYEISEDVYNKIKEEIGKVKDELLKIDSNNLYEHYDVVIDEFNFDGVKICGSLLTDKSEAKTKNRKLIYKLYHSINYIISTTNYKYSKINKINEFVFELLDRSSVEKFNYDYSKVKDIKDIKHEINMLSNHDIKNVILSNKVAYNTKVDYLKEKQIIYNEEIALNYNDEPLYHIVFKDDNKNNCYNSISIDIFIGVSKKTINKIIDIIDTNNILESNKENETFNHLIELNGNKNNVSINNLNANSNLIIKLDKALIHKDPYYIHKYEFIHHLKFIAESMYYEYLNDNGYKLYLEKETSKL